MKLTIYVLKTPLLEEDIKKLKINDTVYLNGTIITARDAAHKKALEFYKKGKKLPINLEGSAIFHSGPIVRKENGNWVVIAAGPTTSARMDLFEPDFIRNFKIRMIIGKGGMGQQTVQAMKSNGAVYGAFTGGAAIIAAGAIEKVIAVEWSDLGMPEALWILEVKDFGPITIAIDSYGNDLFDIIQKKVIKRKKKIYKKLGLD